MNEPITTKEMTYKQWDDKVNKSKNWTEGRDKAYHLTPISTDEDYRIACYFHDKLTSMFSHWNIKFDMTTFELKQHTHTLQHGWNIYYQFGNDPSPYIEVYTSHRMTSDDHFKLYEDGTLISLPAFAHTYVKGEEHITDTHNDMVKQIVYDPEHGILMAI